MAQSPTKVPISQLPKPAPLTPAAKGAKINGLLRKASPVKPIPNQQPPKPRMNVPRIPRTQPFNKMIQQI